MNRKLLRACLSALVLLGHCGRVRSQEMDKMWGASIVKLRPEDAKRGQLFADGNYAMFIHFGLYSLLANKVDGKTYYGIGEWIMNKRMANIPPAEYEKLAAQFNPQKFDAMSIARLAKDAGMKYIVITAKHHDGFAMYHSKANALNIVDATPFKIDPLKELSKASKEVGIGFGFYYSHNQDWTFPGGTNGPQVDEQGKPATFDDYFQKKCLPQVKELTSEYGPIEIVWFDTPGDMPQKYAEQLVAVVRQNQPNALVSSRVGHDLGDYQTLGDMEVPISNVEGLWESVDTTNDSWAYAWYDENWKTPKQILCRVISCIARGGTYMLNVGLRGDGSAPPRAAESLRSAGKWIHRYPQVIYGTDASPWGHALPWGDVIVKGNKLFVEVFDWPASGELYLPGLKTEIRSAKLLSEKGDGVSVDHSQTGAWTRFTLPPRAADELVSVVEVELGGKAEVDPCFGVDPAIKTELQADFAAVTDAKKETKRWMEKFGEWKRAQQITAWEVGGAAKWEVEVCEAGHYQIELTYSGDGRLVWGVKVEGGESIQNQQNSSHNYETYPIGWLEFPKAGRYRVSVSCLVGNTKTASLKGIGFIPVR